MYEYNFPAVTAGADDIAQLKKISGELGEFQDAADLHAWKDAPQALDPLSADACMELLDVIHACETMLRRFDATIVQASAAIVEARNRARGYYDEPTPKERAEAELDALFSNLAEGGK